MADYEMKITQKIPGSYNERLLFSKPLKSEDHKTKLEKKLTKSIHGDYYFFKTKQALKIQNVISRIFKTIIAIFFDLFSIPSNYRNKIKKNKFFKENSPVGKYLQKKGIPITNSFKELPGYIYFTNYNDSGRKALPTYIYDSWRECNKTIVKIPIRE